MFLCQASIPVSAAFVVFWIVFWYEVCFWRAPHPTPPHPIIPRYAFIEYENEDDMRLAYKRGDGRKIDGRRVLVDVERGRTVRNWKV